MHRLAVRVYWEDTDAGGIVYYANYLKFIERARTEWLRQIGVDQVALRASAGVIFVVRRVEADYLAPARFDDVLEVQTRLLRVTGARIEIGQVVTRDDVTLFQARVSVVCLDAKGRAVRIPADVRHRLDVTGGVGPWRAGVI